MVPTSPFHGEIYVHTCMANEKSYVGQTTVGMLARWKDHVKHARLPKCADFKYPFARAIRKYGPEAFEHQVLSVARTKEELDNLERIWIILLQTRDHGYNLGAGGEGNLGLRHKATAIAKMSAAKLGNKHCAGRVCSPESRAKQSLAIKGRTLSPEWRAKIADAGRGRTQSEETKAKIAAGNAGKIFSVETRAKMSMASRGNKRCLGRKFSAETLAKISASQKVRQVRERTEKSDV